MTVETFFQKFELFADAPNAVVKMRELAMWSAFSGAFSAEERNQPMPEEWAIEGAPTLPPIPSSWKWQRGGDVFEVIRGVSYRKSDASDSPVEGSFPVLRANNIGNGVNFDDLVYVPRDNIRDEQFVRRGDILIAMSSGSKKLVGKAAPIVTEFNGAFGAFCGVIRNKSQMLDEVLACYFRSPQYTSWVIAAGRGIGINNLGKGDLDSLPIPTPPLTEQKRIVAKVDELMALCDRLESLQKEREEKHAGLAGASRSRFAESPTPVNLHLLFHRSYVTGPADLRKSILGLAVRGRLVPQDPSDRLELPATSSNGSEALAKCAGAHATEPWAVPDSWRWLPLSEGCRAITDGEHLTPAYVSEGVPILSAKHVGTSSLIWDDLRWVTKQVAIKCWSRCRPEIGDVLVVSRGGGIGRTIISDRDGYCLMGSVLLLKPERFLLSGYLNIYLNSEHGNERLRTTSGFSAQQAIYITHLKRDFTLPLPPLPEQRRIVAKVGQLMGLVDRLETQLANSHTKAETLMEALVAELTAERRVV